MIFKNGLIAVLAAVRANADLLNSLDGVAGDGDLGVTMNIGMDGILDALPSFEAQSMPDVLRECGVIFARKAPSTSGTLVATALLRVAKRAKELGVLGPSEVAELLKTAADGISERGGASEGSKTMLDALIPAARAASAGALDKASFTEIFRQAAQAAEEGVEKTKSMIPKFGRAGWLADRSVGHEDAGARLVAIVLSTIANVTQSA